MEKRKNNRKRQAQNGQEINSRYQKGMELELSMEDMGEAGKGLAGKTASYFL